jgi:Fur family transcriptional regulator, ferric uptake regulator
VALTSFAEERAILAAHLRARGLKRSVRREIIVDAFLESEQHLSVDALLEIARARRSDIGRTTVYRTLKVLLAAGLAREMTVRGETVFEHAYKHEHHDHFICLACGGISEFASPEIERTQEALAARIGFRVQAHRHQILGLCRACTPGAEGDERGVAT